MSELTPQQLADPYIQGMRAAAQGRPPGENPYVLKHPSGAHAQWHAGFTYIRTAMDNAYELAWKRATQQTPVINPFTGHKEQ